MTADEIEDFLQSHFSGRLRDSFRVEEVEEMRARVRLVYSERLLRPGGTVSGPALMTLADTAMYVALLATIGPVALAVTTNLNINFLRRPGPADVLGSAVILKLGKRLAFGEVTMVSESESAAAAHATVTYSIPDPR